MTIHNSITSSVCQNVESVYINEAKANPNNGPVTVNTEYLKTSNLSLSKQYSNIERFVQQNHTTSINWKTKGDILTNAISCLEATQSFNLDMRNVVLDHIKNTNNDDTKIDTLEKSLAFLETERKLSDLVSNGQISLETAIDTLDKCLKLGSQENFDLDKLNEFNNFLENPQDKDIGKKLNELFNSSEVRHETVSLQSQQEVTEAIPHSNKDAKLSFEKLSEYPWAKDKDTINGFIKNFINENNGNLDKKSLNNIQKTLEKNFAIDEKTFNKAWAEAISKTQGGEVIDNGPVTLNLGGKEVKMQMTFTPQAKMSGFPGDTTGMKHCSSVYQSANIGDTNHAVNLWRQDISLPVAEEQQKTQSMSFLRHGYVLEQKTAAKEILANACVLQHGEEAILSATKDNPLKLSFSNVQLMSFGNLADKDKPWKQMQIFNQLADERQPLELEYGKNKVWVNFERPLLFNFGVNLQHFRHLELTNSDAKQKVKNQNLESFKQLFGANFPNLQGNNFDGLIKTKLESFSDDDPKKQQIQTLANQILEIYQSHPEGLKKNPYALPTRVLALTNLLGYAGSFNCKSGKDRTGVCAMELSNLCAQMISGEAIANPMNPITEQEQKNLQAIYKEGSCARDISHINTVFQENLKIDQTLKFVANEKRFGVDLSKSFESNISKLNSQT